MFSFGSRFQDGQAEDYFVRIAASKRMLGASDALSAHDSSDDDQSS
jgi:hypothetical protein